MKALLFDSTQNYSIQSTLPNIALVHIARIARRVPLSVSGFDPQRPLNPSNIWLILDACIEIQGLAVFHKEIGSDTIKGFEAYVDQEPIKAVVRELRAMQSLDESVLRQTH